MTINYGIPFLNMPVYVKSTVLDVDLTLSCLHGQIKVLDFTDKNSIPFENSSDFFVHSSSFHFLVLSK